jgi:hypothetical protein
MSDGWIGTKGTMGWEKRNVLFTHPDFAGVRIRHCCHPTANYPWFTYSRDGELRTFRTLAMAKAYVTSEYEQEAAT